MLTGQQASDIAAAAMREGSARKLAPLCVVVLDAGGHLLALQRHERASFYRPQIAQAKAGACLGMGFGGSELARRAKAAPAFYGALGAVASHGMLPVPGGVLIRDANGLVIGSAGISGDSAENDESCAVAGIQAVGLDADTGATASP